MLVLESYKLLIQTILAPGSWSHFTYSPAFIYIALYNISIAGVMP